MNDAEFKNLIESISVHLGNGVPDLSLGKDLDLYIDQANRRFYRKYHGTWTTNAEAVIGPVFMTGGGTAVQEYFINGTAPDMNGNFTVTAAMIGASPVNHKHSIAEVVGLQELIDAKSPINHTHNMISSLSANGVAMTGPVTLEAGENVSFQAHDNNIIISVNQVSASSAESMIDIVDQKSGRVKLFLGTEAEWNAFHPEESQRYLVVLF